ncbi:MAG: hypothetical protein IK002_10325 [Treponema sp.]|uniref:hypothetical protein n=1 Tax=Treponema sp. TaxID=166 RepID=UPI00298DEE79|nr:hypothetical protein [Treponema sp.]MBR5934370.1 hypothetical protein [Treponema sp.]
MDLNEIDALIQETDYSVALVELSNYLKDHPEQLDKVQKRIDKIMKAREQYIVLANELIDVMEREPENAQKKLEIIAQLETVEKKPTEEQLQFIRQAKIAAQFTYYRAQFRHITEDSSAAVDKGEYSDAVSKIQKGFTMYRQEFYEDNPKSVTDGVTQTVNQINALCKEYSNAQDKLRNAYNNFLKAIENFNYRDAANTYTVFNSEMQNLANIRNQVYRNAVSLRDVFTRLQRQNPELTEASYLPFIFRFTLGQESNSQSGIIGAMDTQYKNYIEGIKPAIYNAVQKVDIGRIDTTNAATVKQEDLPLQRLAAISNFADLGVTVDSMYSKITDGFKYPAQYPQYDRSMRHASDVTKYMNQSYAILADYQNTNAILAKIERPADAVEGIRSKNSYASQMIECSRQYDLCSSKALSLLNEEFYTGYKQELEQNSKNKNTENTILEFKILDTYYSVINNSLYDLCIKASQTQWRQTAQYFASAATDIVSHYQEEYNKVSETLNNRYPKEALDMIMQIENDLNNDAATLENCRLTLAQSSIDKSSFASEQKAVIDSVAKMNSFKETGSQTKAKCNSEILLSQSAINEAELRYNQAVNAYKRNDYTAARKNIELASLKYKESLDHQESQNLREESDRKLVALGQQINDAENRLVVAEVRKLKNNAKNEYYNGNFEKAETLLNQAKSRWAVTNGDEKDEEIENLFALVETALSMKTGRVIPPTAPLYPEMSQILSIAHQYYDQGAALIKKGERDDGLEALNKARKKLQEVQLVYPLNQEASLLTLRIDQISDPQAFNTMFERKYNSAKANYKNPAKIQEAYSDLKDLAEIRPDYPGLKKTIDQVEMELGLKKKPVDLTSVNRSQTLTREAQSIINSAGRNEVQLKNALAKLDEAIKLNPNNDQAYLLKDRVQISLGGRASIVMTAADEAKYQQAIQELQKNNIVGAYALVEQLLQNSDNRRCTKVLDLQKKVKALL